MAREPYRFRECPRCGRVKAAGEFPILNYRGQHYHKVGGSKRRCKYCGFVGFTQQFKVVHNA